METVKNLFFQDHHIYQKYKLLKISSSQDHHILPNMETVKNLFFQDHHTNQK